MNRIAEHPFGDSPTGLVIKDALSTPGKMLRGRLLMLCSHAGPEGGFQSEDSSRSEGGSQSEGCLRSEGGSQSEGCSQEEGGFQSERLSMLAAMVELLHLASLIHDDIIDEADIRRGKPSIQKRYGKDAAVYAGDYIMARVNYYEAVEHFNEASAVLSNAVASMCSGEISQAANRYRTNPSLEAYMETIAGKTAALIRSACQIGAAESGAPAPVVEALSEYGHNLGLLFQIRDDLLDFNSASSREGKDVHKDLKSGIYTSPVIFALASGLPGSERLRELLEKNALSGLSGDELKEAETLVIDLGGVKKASELMNSLAQKAREALSPIDCNGKLKDLYRILDELIR